MTKEEIYDNLSTYLQDIFEIPKNEISLDAKLYETLDLDSIDAVDLIVKLQELTGRKIPPQEFKSVRTVGDVVDRVYALVSE